MAWLIRFRFRPRRGLLSLLPRDLLRPVDIVADGAAQEGGRLESIWRTSGRSHKWRHYFPIYERQLGRLVGRSSRVLEIGVSTGGSLRMWKTYLGDQATIVGIDIDPTTTRHEDAARGIYVRVGSQTDAAFLRRVADEFGPFDAVIDDGSHVVSHMVVAFGALFDQGLAPGGVYLVEDTHATYWKRHRDRPHAFSTFVRDLMDLRHAPYWGATRAAYFEQGRLPKAVVPRLVTMLGDIEVFDSVVAIHKLCSEARLPVTMRSEAPAEAGAKFSKAQHSAA